jgi:REP element-mobilizing transposase RayT
MSLFKNKYRNESARLSGWDYSKPGYYFVTVCTHDRGCLFGEIVYNEMRINECGKIAYDEWYRSFEIRAELIRDEFVVMPNHIHGIVRILESAGTINPVGTHGNTNAGTINPVGTHGNTNAGTINPVGTHGRASLPDSPIDCGNNFGVAYRSPKSVSSFMAGFKSVVTKRINELRNTPGVPVWQPRFHDHIVRNEQELFRIRNYIKNNPVNWGKDKFSANDDNILREDSPIYEKEDWMIIA